MIQKNGESTRSVEVRFKSNKFKLNYWDLYKLSKSSVLLIFIFYILNFNNWIGPLIFILIQSILRLFKGKDQQLYKVPN